MGFPGGARGEEQAANAGDVETWLDPWSGKPSAGERGNPLQSSCGAAVGTYRNKLHTSFPGRKTLKT